jgi:murein DD-endopeptidase MepM/ murein hydrolase activator NlpD
MAPASRCAAFHRKCFVFAVIVSLTAASHLLAQEKLKPAKADPNGPLYSLPYEPGTSPLVVQGYLEFPTHENEYAIDWLMPEETPILAVRDGIVTKTESSFSESGLKDELRDKGNHVVIRHDDGAYSAYWHIEQDGVKVKVGQRVREGETIALSGNTGYSATPHLHFVVYHIVDGRRESFPTLFKSGGDRPFAIVPGGKYLAPGGAPKPEEGPLAGVKGTGELSSIRPRLLAMVRAVDNPKQAAVTLKKHLLKNRAAYHDLYKKTFAKAQKGDKSAMRELQEFLNQMDLQAQPEIAALLADEDAKSTADEAVQIWWALFAMS